MDYNRNMTKYNARIRAAFLMTAFGVMTVAALFLPTWQKYVPTGENIYDVSLNGIWVGCTDEPERMEDVLQHARENVVREDPGLVLIEAELDFSGRSMTFGRVDGARAIGRKMQEVLEQSRMETLQRAYTVKINEYTVNLRTSGEVLSLLNACLRKYDSEKEYAVDLVVDPDRELNVLTTSVFLAQDRQDPDAVAISAGVGAYFEETFTQVQPTMAADFSGLDYGLMELDFADTVEVVEAYLMEDELTGLEEAVDQVTKEQEKEQIYEVQPGDTLSHIALDNSLTVDYLVSINPGLEDADSTIRSGDELIITVPEPELSVTRRELIYEEDSYDAPVEYVDVDSWYTTRRETVQEPSAGYRKAASVKTYRNDEELEEEVVLEEIVYEAVPRIIKRGTMVPPTYIRPVSGGRTSSPFGRRSAPTRGASTNHHGVDIALPVGTAVMASSGGTVTRAGWGSGYGYVVYIQHADGKETRYGHLSKVLVSVGQRVDQGQKIALSGNTGRSTGPHLHFEMRINGSPVNPMSYLN